MTDLLIPLLRQCPLALGLDTGELAHLALCFHVLSPHAKGKLLSCPCNGPAPFLLLSGRAQVSRSDEEGDLLPLVTLHPGDLWGLGELLIGDITVTEVTALEPGRAARLHPARWADLAPKLQIKLWRNAARLLAGKNAALRTRLAQLAAKSLREKILSLRTTPQGRAMTHSAMAQWLACDRSALSRELSRMKRDGLID